MPPSKKDLKDSRIISGEGPPKKKTLAQKIPLGGWLFIFVFPLVLSEFMFYVVGKWMSMILFGIAWIGFWLALMVRSDWAIFKNRHKED
ncbi:MAG: hypothetical protein NUV68_00560 [Caldiserica bacterium]|jgi:hypothetical protein|nr:hypothetical protein [Caldisericota bacterium]MDH7561850.1 hypothetical protein [Caldisericota bacterium]